MDVVEQVETGAGVDELFALVSDLGTYPGWLGLVARVDAEAPAPSDDAAAWIVELRGRIGPLTRSKRLRMVRSFTDDPRRVRFVRAETDGRDHAPWTLIASVRPNPRGSTLTMELHYGGNRFASVLTPLLRDEIGRGRRALQERYPLEC